MDAAGACGKGQQWLLAMRLLEAMAFPLGLHIGESMGGFHKQSPRKPSVLVETTPRSCLAIPFLVNLVVWNINFICPYIGNNHPNWRIFFRGVETTNQLVNLQDWLTLPKEMSEKELLPNVITYSSAISACSSSPRTDSFLLTFQWFPVA